MDFLLTKEYLRFAEFANACTQYRYIGLCYGTPGVGKTMSAKHYSAYNSVNQYDRMKMVDATMKQQLQACKAVFHTAQITNNPQRLKVSLFNKMQLLGTALLQGQGKTDITQIALESVQACPLVIVDEADRLKINTLEQLRDIYDTYGFGLILIGMPGIEKRLMRYPQLYSRIGFAHEFRPLFKKDLLPVINQFCNSLDIAFPTNSNQHEETVNTILAFSGGNFRLTQRLFGQIKRILQINKLELVDKDVVEAARNLLIVGYQD